MMRTTTQGVMFWTPRLLGLALSLFLAVFALDAFRNGARMPDAILDFLVHLLPSLVVVTLVAASWRREWIGVMAFAILGVAYAATMARGHVDWMVLISGPLILVSALFLCSWLNQRRSGRQV